LFALSCLATPEQQAALIPQCFTDSGKVCGVLIQRFKRKCAGTETHFTGPPVGHNVYSIKTAARDRARDLSGTGFHLREHYTLNVAPQARYKRLNIGDAAIDEYHFFGCFHVMFLFGLW
jgi:hypothetical protein